MFKIDFTVGEHGWANAELTVGNVTEACQASYVSDPLRELALTAIRVVDPRQEVNSAYYEPGSICFGGEPEGLYLDLSDEVSGEFTFRHYEIQIEHGYVFEPPDPKVRKVLITLSFSEDSMAQKVEKKGLSSEETTAYDFGLEAHRVLSKVLDDIGIQAYYKSWTNYFPLPELAHLTHVLGLAPREILLG